MPHRIKSAEVTIASAAVGRGQVKTAGGACEGKNWEKGLGRDRGLRPGAVRAGAVACRLCAGPHCSCGLSLIWRQAAAGAFKVLEQGDESE
jgi:hypothetical protein